MSKKKKHIIVIIIASVLLVIPLFIIYNFYCDTQVNTLTLDNLDNYNFTKASNLMIVAHPDDETLWGSKLLLDGNWCVVCITSGNNKTRSKEFQSVIKYCGCTGIILDYPDKINGLRSNWKSVQSKIEKDIAIIVNYKAWDKIVTHNPDGEYGHQHHILTSNIVTNICKDSDLSNTLYYFGKYYKKDDISKVKGLTEISSAEKDTTNKMFEFYASQQSTIKKLKHMTYHQTLIKADSWPQEENKQ